MRQQVESCELEGDFLTLTVDHKPLRVDLDAVTVSSTRSWLGLSKIAVSAPQGRFDLAGLSHNDSADVLAAVREAQHRKQVLDKLACQDRFVAEALDCWDALAARDAYLTVPESWQWQAGLPALSVPAGTDADLMGRLPAEIRDRLLRIISLRAKPEQGAARRNAGFTAREMAAFRQFFDAVESNPLTDQQRQAIVHDEDNTLVIAGAGTGKTSTVVGKVGYLLKKGWAKPEEILLLAFTDKAAQEMRERVAHKLGAEIPVRTFHALGLEIIAQAEGKKPSLCPEASDPVLKAQTIMALTAELMAGDDFRRDMLAFRSSLRRAYKPAWEFRTQREYTQYLLDVEPRALSGRLMRSYEECEIANWLVTHGIAVQYERPYEVVTATANHRQYTPDFYLPEHGLYIEHFGVDRNGNTAPFVPREEYLAGMEWKRAQHAANGTLIVETYSWERQEGILLTGLEAKLRQHGIIPSPISTEVALQMLNVQGRVDPFASLIGTFLSLFKSAGHRIEDLWTRTEQQSGLRRDDNHQNHKNHQKNNHQNGDGQNPHNRRSDARNRQFLALFQRLLATYEALLHQRGEIDFDDMIIQAHSHVETGAYRSPFRYILVDEFQDISAGRASLVQALKKQVPGTKLFCVGDDWQSIYRFAGSDISLTTDFERHFGPTYATALERTFRFHDKIAAFSSAFVQKNPGQLRKHLSTVTVSNQAGVVVYPHDSGDDPLPSILEMIDHENEGARDQSVGNPESRANPASVFVLFRYGFNKPESLSALRRRFSNLRIEAMTAHKAKGLEADYVVIVGLTRGKYGFPSEIAVDPILGLALPEAEAFGFAEERRLFYVALTRAKRRVYLAADPAHMSSFVDEILSDSQFEKMVIGPGFSHSHPGSSLCPACERGKVTRREGEFGPFYSCSNYPICAFKAMPCSRCKQGRMREEVGSIATCDSCSFHAQVCPKCRLGVLVARKSRQRGFPFWGCSRFGQRQASCTYTERMDSLERIDSFQRSVSDGTVLPAL